MKKKVAKVKEVKIAYTIEDKFFGELKIKKTANAWWKDREKVVKLIQGYKMDCKPGELRILAGISEDQRKYFMEVHPEFSLIFEDLRSNPVLKARATVIDGIGKDANIAFKYLERKASEEFRERKDIEFSKKPSLIEGMFSDDDEK
jgi:hypothetical protein